MAAQEYDVIIVGSGAGGGMATLQLANAGLKIALVEAGGHSRNTGRPSPGRTTSI